MRGARRRGEGTLVWDIASNDPDRDGRVASGGPGVWTTRLGDGELVPVDEWTSLPCLGVEKAITGVVVEAVEAVPIERMVVADCEAHHAGGVVGYFWQECGQADETLDQIWHQEDCQLAGEHGRQHYEEVDSAQTPASTTRADGSSPADMVQLEPIDLENTRDYWRFTCPNGHHDWSRANPQTW